jgi:hypothetical protein
MRSLYMGMEAQSDLADLADAAVKCALNRSIQAPTNADFERLRTLILSAGER